MRNVKKLFQWSEQRGDTIVEVLIAISIVSLILTSAYAVTNRNAQVAQKIQEQGQAQKLVEREIELLRTYDGTIPAGWCLVSDGSGVTATSGAPCDQMTAEGSGATYKLTITGSSSYQITATWDALGGQTGNVTMYYRR